MATTQGIWHWDAARRQYYYEDAATKARIYQDGSRVPYNDWSTSTQSNWIGSGDIGSRYHTAQMTGESSHVRTNETASNTYPIAKSTSQYTETATNTWNPIHHQYQIITNDDSSDDRDYSNLSELDFMNANELLREIEVVQDNSLYHGDSLFESPPGQLH
jgi:hypothetical protein